MGTSSQPRELVPLELVVAEDSKSRHGDDEVGGKLRDDLPWAGACVVS